MKAFDLKLNPGQRVVVVSGPYVIGNENNDKVEIHVLDGPEPVIDPEYVKDTSSFAVTTIGYRDFYKKRMHLPCAVHEDHFDSEVFRYSEKDDVRPVVSGMHEAAEKWGAEEYKISFIDGPFIDSNYDKDLFRFRITMVKEL